MSYTLNANLNLHSSSLEYNYDSPVTNSSKEIVPSLFISKMDTTLFTKGF